ncbi:hypothetical protein TVAG_485090 [Trichomonas vaginalis G3]|uniref:Uncharacterized protein n=1 Tax=Trichomonas vaginalis (strain ATCC PRA-98 / G3) TaxID=412133 RepID=A2EZ25_TRIV3|nr:spectrin binding [Trichomonas vaginalis G3]EAY02074.1 hypothetical protein TVAG_485090 [Trichomonas vaginalis G3]KAI5512738.1 spectrin binding [Trichomonas vaginalis G3]|eukprot:XP_001330527.1 hypothetical protein [Trichomonas vaginalis G3]
MSENIIVYDNLKIKNFGEVVIPQALELLLQVEDHYFNLNQEKFEDSINFFKKFITDGPGETQNDNFKYLLELFVNGKLMQSHTDNLHFNIIQTLRQIFKPLIRSDDILIYSKASDAGIDVSIPYELRESIIKQEIGPKRKPDEFTQLIYDDNVSKFQQYIETHNYDYSYTLKRRIFKKPSLNILKFILISGNSLEKFNKSELFEKSNLSKAVSSGHIELIRLLEQNGANYNNFLSDAFKSRNYELINWILENYQQEKVKKINISNLRSLIFCLENNICTNYYNFYKIFYESKFKSILEFLATYKLDFQQIDSSEIVLDTLKNKRFDYFNIFYDLGLIFPDRFVTQPLTYLVENYDPELYEKVYQFIQRNPSTRFTFSRKTIQEILSNLEILTFFVEKKLITDIGLREILSSGGIEEMNYAFSHLHAFDVNEFNSLFSFFDQFTLLFKPELIKYILENNSVSLEKNNGFNLMKFAFSSENIDLMNCLLDKGVKLVIKEENKDFYNPRTVYIHLGDEKDEDEVYDEDFDDLRLKVYNVLDGATHNNLEAYKLILERGGKAIAKGSGKCKTLLDYHASKGNTEIVKLLLEHGTKVTKYSFNHCKDSKTMNCLIENSEKEQIEDLLEELIEDDKKPSGFLYFTKKYPIKEISLYKLLKCLTKALKVKNEAICIYILNNAVIQDEEDIDSMPDEAYSWLIRAVDINSSFCVKLILAALKTTRYLDGYFDPEEAYCGFYSDNEDNDIEPASFVIPDYFLHAAKMNNTEIVKELIKYEVPS